MLFESFRTSHKIRPVAALQKQAKGPNMHEWPAATAVPGALSKALTLDRAVAVYENVIKANTIFCRAFEEKFRLRSANSPLLVSIPTS
jgi:hypothetical protein